MKKILKKFGVAVFGAVLLMSYIATGISAKADDTDSLFCGNADGASESASGFPLLQGEIRFRLPDLLFPSKKGEEKQDKDNMTPDRSQRMLIPGGMAFGVRLRSDGVLIVGMAEVAEDRVGYEAGLRIGDVIVEIEKTPVKNAVSLTDAIMKSEGKPLLFKVLRGGKEHEIRVTPKKSPDGGYLVGIIVRDGAAGIGTVTFIDPETGAFGGLGHGICDSASGALIPLRRGSVMRVLIDSIERGKAGEPGEIRGALCPDKIGTLFSNTDCGVFGVLVGKGDSSKALPIAKASEVRPGKATLRCTLDNGAPADYEIEIGEIRREARGAKCFAVRVTDPALIEKTGGIVQGMSGSPIIQNGKLVGAVTHVMVADPTEGYGIFIENMLSAANEQMQ